MLCDVFFLVFLKLSEEHEDSNQIDSIEHRQKFIESGNMLNIRICIPCSFEYQDYIDTRFVVIYFTIGI